VIIWYSTCESRVSVLNKTGKIFIKQHVEFYPIFSFKYYKSWFIVHSYKIIRTVTLKLNHKTRTEVTNKQRILVFVRMQATGLPRNKYS
jgi:hypothetical protein